MRVDRRQQPGNEPHVDRSNDDLLVGIVSVMQECGKRKREPSDLLMGIGDQEGDLGGAEDAVKYLRELPDCTLRTACVPTVLVRTRPRPQDRVAQDAWRKQR